jgi:hypothetical protein
MSGGSPRLTRLELHSLGRCLADQGSTMTNRNQHIHSLNYLTLSAVLLGGCALPEEPSDDPSVLADDGSFDAADELESSEQAVPRTEVLGLDEECAELLAPIIAKILPDATGAYDCSFPNMPAGWDAAPLFSAGSPWMAAQVLAVPLPSNSPLHQYCQYEYVGNNPNDPVADYEQLFSSGIGRFDGAPATDCPSVTGQGGLDNPNIVGASSDAFMNAVDAIDPTALASLNLGNTVHTYLLDTKHANIPAYDPHADRLRTMLEDLACADGRPGCSSSIHQILVAPLRNDEDFTTSHWDVDENEQAGGTHGYVHQTALGIAIAVLDWRDQNDDGDPDTLERGVINLSMGAVPSSSYATNINYAPAQAVLDAMRMAACYDMPIFVAAGNRDVADAECDDPGEGLLLPAVYESLVMPTPMECQAWGYVPDWDTTQFPRFVDSIAMAKPMVTAVSAVDHEDNLLPTNRIDSTTTLAAPALGAVTPSGTTPLTGTSVATLVATAGANLIWSADPGLSSRDVSRLLYSTGWDTGLTTDAGWYMNAAVNRVSLCAAVNDWVGGLNCSATEPNHDATALIGTATLATVAQAQQLEQLVSFAHENSGSAPVCEQQLIDLMFPQPERPHCANCSVGTNTGSGGLHTLYMTIGPETWAESMTVTAAVLYVTDAALVTTSYALGSSVLAQINEMNSQNIIEVTFSHQNPASASVKFTYTGASGTLSANNPLVLW